MAAEWMRGRWFDGRSSQARPVVVTLAPAVGGPALRMRVIGGPAEEHVFAARDVDWPEAWGTRRNPRKLTVDLRDAGAVEIDDPARWHREFLAAGGRPALAQRMQSRWTVFLVVLAASVLLLGAFYRWGTPWAATQVTRQVPLAWETAFAARAMAQLDGAWLAPSKLPAQRQQALRARFDSLARQVDAGLHRQGGYAPALTLAFRSGLGPNAFALPGGTVVMTDAMVEHAAREKLGDEALAGVLAHEIGHVFHRHTTRMLVEQAVLNVGLGLALGDVSSLVSLAGSALTGLAYRRSHETEADCFGLALMRKAGLPTAPTAKLLLSIEGERGGRGEEKATALGSLLSTHPQTAERARALERGEAPGC